MDKGLTKPQLKALARCFDNGVATAKKNELVPTVRDFLIKNGLIKPKVKKALTFVGRSLTLYQVTYKGQYELHVSGMRRILGMTTKQVQGIDPVEKPWPAPPVKPIVNDSDDGEVDKPFWLD